MFIQAIRKIIGTQNERDLKSIIPIVQQINHLEPKIKKLSDYELKNKTSEFKQRLENKEPLDSLLPESFAVVREASFRSIHQRHYDVQLIGGVCLHRGKIAEMRTGEGKTLVATLPSYLNALTGKGVHVVTVNDYLAKRDAEWMSQIYGFLGLSTGIIVHSLNDRARKQNYACDITYGTNNEFGFDYLRDNMKFSLDDYVQRDLYYAIVDEVDSILIDEARTPLIISGPTDETTDLYYQIDRHIRSGAGLTAEQDYTIDEKLKTAALTEAGVDKIEARLGIKNLYDPNNIQVLHHVNQALRAHVLFKKDVDYVVQKGQVIIVDEFTGRLMPGRRWSDGLHQAIEAKEGVEIENENQTLASITFQNYFRMYEKLAGMTGTADTEALEFKQIYKLEVNVIPTNKPMIRKDHSDQVLKSAEIKYKHIVKDIKRLREKKQPVLVGTVSVEKSEYLAQILRQENIPHYVLNAKNHEREAEIVAQAGKKGAVTISTNMAGRGTDILLGGNPSFLARSKVGSMKPNMTPLEAEQYEQKYQQAYAQAVLECEQERKEVLEAGGLFILGTERHDSRRIDNQLRGRAGRQGDPGESRFYLSLEDDLIRLFGNMGEFMKKRMDDDIVLEHKMLNKSIQTAQQKVEAGHYDMRKHLLEYDDVMNQQRTVVYRWRKEVLSLEDLSPMFFSMIEEVAENIAESFFPNGRLKKEYELKESNLSKEISNVIHITFHSNSTIEEADVFSKNHLKKYLIEVAKNAFEAKKTFIPSDRLHEILKIILLSTIDHLWKDHLLAMDHLKEGVNLQSYGQKDPVIVYKKQGFMFFSAMMNQITTDVVQKFYSLKFDASETETSEVEPTKKLEASPIRILRPVEPNKNDLCFCGSGRRYKRCHGSNK